MAMSDDVRRYYDSFGEREWERLNRPNDGAIEFALTKRVIADYLPDGARVLDIGGDPGRYTIWLAERGHRVTLADLSPTLIAIARDRVAASPSAPLVDEITVADARDLSAWTDGEFDTALPGGSSRAGAR